MKVGIVGAGVSGLVAAIELEKAGVDVEFFEGTDAAGGRIKTTLADDVPFDHGFQVLQTAYPLVKEYLNVDALDLKKFKPGAAIFSNGNIHKIGDAFRDGSFFWSTISAPIGSFRDKLKVLALANMVKKMSINDVFSVQEQSTQSYLKAFGFSDRIIDSFFKPFYSGIFFETELKTSVRKFLFTYKMFAQGYAAIPNKGIEAIPNQLRDKLSKATFNFNKKVNSIEDAIVYCENEKYEFDYVIDATNRSDKIKWLTCNNFYFNAPESKLNSPILGLIANQNVLINNLHYLTDIQSVNSKKSILSVTVIGKHKIEESEFVEKVKSELKTECNITNLEFIRRFEVKKALPDLGSQSYGPNAESLWVDSKTLKIGDHTCNASLNSAMLSGKLAAHAVIGK
ncbi:MAG: FAD-dependent oxidoreductase [Bacteroidia bacterium]